jgi:rRNA maturation endonuclease Nob1
MLVCTKCQIEHEEGKKFCWNCGTPLVARENSGPDRADSSRKEEVKSQDALICPVCKWAYEWGKFCTKCGSALGSQLAAQAEENRDPAPSSSEPESLPQEEEAIEPFEIVESPKKRLVCPSCKLIYEGRETCIRCGVALVEQTAPSAVPKEEPPSPAPETPETPEMPDAEREDALGLELNRIEESITPQSRETRQAAASISPSPFPSRDTVEEGPERESAVKTTEGRAERKIIVPSKKRINLRRLPLEMLSILILVVAGGYLLWSLYTRVIMKKPEPGNPPSKGSSEPAERTAPAVVPSPPPASSVPVPSSPPLAPESGEIEEIKKLLETIRKANLEKNIDLFMSCYASNFRDREGKRKDVLGTWKDFTYQDLSFDLSNESVSGETAHARVEWLSKISSARGGKPQESKTLLEVSFYKEENSWKIRETKVIE